MTRGDSKGIFGVKQICNHFQPGGGTISVSGPYLSLQVGLVW